MRMVAHALDLLLEPIADCLTDESAERIARVTVDATIQARLDELARKSSEGVLTADEHGEYVDLVEAIDVIGMLQAKARRVLSRRIVT
jgi:hypothetical protein